VVGIELREDGRDYDPKTLPSVFAGFPIIYIFEKDRRATEAANRARWLEKEEERVRLEANLTYFECGKKGHHKQDCLQLIKGSDCGEMCHARRDCQSLTPGPDKKLNSML
jgi:hypothetical protein